MEIFRDTAANLAANNPLLFDGQIGRETDTGRFKFGNGATRWNALPYVVEGVIGTRTIAAAAATIRQSDAGQRLKVTVECTVWVPAASEAPIVPGSYVAVQQFGAGAVTISAPAGVTLNGVDGGAAVMSGAYQLATVFCDAANVWTVSGGVGAVT